jgi:hypothetical protein
MLFVLIWVIAIGIGYFLGVRKNRPVAGVLLTICLGPLGWFVMACLEKKPAGDAVATLPETSPAPLPSKGLDVGPPPLSDRTEELQFHVARDGKDLGPMTVRRIRQLVSAGELAPTDSYFDPQLKAWTALNLLPE